MTGPEHYREAERLLELADNVGPDAEIYAEAQIHATLALAAATADQPSTYARDAVLRRAWAAVTGPFTAVPKGGDR